MSQALQTDVSILNLSGGRRERNAPTVRIVEPASGIAPAEGKGNLYILIELVGPESGRGRLIRELLNTMQETYYQQADPVPEALSAALQAAHAQLQGHNQYYATHFSGGATCLAVNGTEIVLAQAGPAILAVRSRGAVQWFSPLNNESYLSLGGQTMPSVEVGRVAGEPGAVVVAMNSAWADYLEVPLMNEALAIPQAQAVADQLAGIGIGAGEELTLFVISLTAGQTARPPARPPAPSPRPAPPAVRPAPAAEISLPAAHRPAPPAGATAGQEAGQTAPPPVLRPAPAPAKAPSLAAAPDRRPSAIRRGPPSRRLPYALAIAGVLLLAILAITAGMWYVQGRQRAELFNQYLQGANIQYQAAANTGDENQKRLYLQAADEQLNQAALFFPEHEDLVKMRSQIAEAKAAVNHIQPLLVGFDLPLIAFDAASREPQRVFVNGLTVFVLDAQTGVLERYQLDEGTGDRLAGDGAPVILAGSGTDVGGRRMGEVADAVWSPPAGNRTATGPLVIDRSNQLFGYSEGLGAVNVTLAANPDLGLVTDMENYNGNLYLLDTSRSQYWRYRASGETYENPPEAYFPPEVQVNLSTVIDSAIDGSVWMLNPNGTVFKFFSGTQDAFALDVVDPPLTQAVTIWVNDADPPDGRIFIGDAASNRVLVFDKQGKLLSQLMPSGHPGALNTLRSLFVDETNNYLYLLTDSALYQTPLPTIANPGAQDQPPG
jgi:hypothetical protein